jgi:predicted nuclease of predicted toxin-antitoxin system
VSDQLEVRLRFLADANLPRAVATLIEAAGHIALEVTSVFPAKTDDDVLAQFARDQQCVILTRDWDFADLRRYPPESYFGIVVLALDRHAKRQAIVDLVATLLNERELLRHVAGRLIVVERDRIRVRPAIPTTP